jgi:S-methylmethionine-dependent homocysteine/selenocysteine methylase
MTYRDRLPQLDGGLFLTDGGIETVLIFHEGLDLPAFAAFDLLKDATGTETLRRYYAPYAALARDRGVGYIAESPTWRANPRWAAEIGYGTEELERFNRQAIALMEEVRAEYGRDGAPVVISGCVGPHDDGYDPAVQLSAEDAETYHSTQIATFADTAADMVTAITMTYVEEAIGVVRAAQRHGLPVAIAFTVETDGRLPSGTTLRAAIERVDAETGSGPSIAPRDSLTARGGPAYYMINCAHPTHFTDVLGDGDGWQERIRGLRANASTRSHAELDAAEDLDAGDPGDLGSRYAALTAQLPFLNVMGGCCGTDHRHIAAISDALVAA